MQVDLNLRPDEEYGPPYSLEKSRISREHFSIIHTGEGDGWNTEKPCMGSIVCYKEKLYLIDAGPNILTSLVALGISVNDLEGIFQTHAHDDHFAGFTSLIRMDRRLKYYATPFVRASVERKLAALMGMRPGEFGTYFEIRDLAAETWNDLDGLEVNPFFPPPRGDDRAVLPCCRGKGGYRTFAHLADIIDFSILGGMVGNGSGPGVISRGFHDEYTTAMLQRVDVKKIDPEAGYPRKRAGLPRGYVRPESTSATSPGRSPRWRARSARRPRSAHRMFSSPHRRTGRRTTWRRASSRRVFPGFPDARQRCLVSALSFPSVRVKSSRSPAIASRRSF